MAENNSDDGFESGEEQSDQNGRVTCSARQPQDESDDSSSLDDGQDRGASGGARRSSFDIDSELDTGGNMYDGAEGEPDDILNLVLECLCGLTYIAVCNLLARSGLDITYKAQIDENRHVLLLNRSDVRNISDFIRHRAGNFRIHDYLPRMLDGHVKLTAMLEVPEGVVYNRVSDSDICFNLQESLSPVFDHLTSISLLDRCEIVFKDRLGGSRDIHIDLTLRELEVMRTHYVEQGLEYHQFDMTREDVTIRYKLECNNSSCPVNCDDVDGINVTETDDLDNGQQGRAVEHQTSTGSTLVVHGSYKANNIQEETLLKEEALPPCLIALISGSMTAEELNRNIRHEPLTMVDIKTYDAWVPTYIIPYNQSRVKRYGLIFYSKKDRAGAIKEADNMHGALKAAEFEVIKKEWSRTRDLKQMINDQKKKIAGKCSLLFVMLMTHGCNGYIRGPSGENILINDILLQIDTLAASHIPKVIIIQSCRGQGQTIRRISGDQTLISLTRPNTVLLSATVPGGKAYRGAFTGALSDQISHADGKADILEMFQQANKQLQKEHPMQTPVLWSTLSKYLVLPPSIQVASEVVQDKEPDVISSADPIIPYY